MLIDPKTVIPKAQGMSNMGKMAGMLGLALILASFAIGIYVGNLNNQYWVESKEIREAAKAGEFFVVTWQRIEVWRQWQNMLQFLGMGMLLFGIMVQLVIIVKALFMQGSNMFELLGGGKSRD
ncbi:MAG: hypothetical protein COU81_03040 [Candidatus Portnoybacteria bacterium CG10_big_fil_rev_8_21_14_0_10_36_7]|uniref:Uncharacterized protein n=1 Tax=Candidatus Portnoybacteria bacterium CG10_big_fil_rev_8_21_14_0_10_36_7 TaxID=1974812 RepID=A0A2M8KDL4_9BACT|nr:MAG: hypothetical protein COU81_03040 [Candidatus Portnoybacteria bacterium CG10_big_fil_rev_8_21_14_0_10_36_7]